ncbi:MAG TPA: phage tail protein [Terracidiphilus sp.]
MSTAQGIVPLHIFRFRVAVTSDSLANGPQGSSTEMSFAECTGLEATMEPKTIKEGGRNYGAAQRAGGVSFATVIFKRGVSQDRGMWQIFNTTTSGRFAPRLQVTITLLDGGMQPLLTWQLAHAMPVKFKFADLNAKGQEVGIEELHFVHEGLTAV